MERETRIVGGTMGVVPAPFSPGGRALSNDAFRTIDKLDDIFKTPSTISPQSELITPEGFGIKIPAGKTPLEKLNEPMEISISSEKANEPHINRGNRPPYSGLRAQEIVLKQETVFVRVHDEIVEPATGKILHQQWGK